MKIVHFAEYASGGVATYLENLIKSQVKQKNVEKVFLVLSKYKSSDILLNISDPKVKVISYDYKRSFGGIIKLLCLKRKILSLRPDIIHIHSSFAGILRLRFLFSKVKRKIIYCSHGWSFNRDVSNLKKTLLKFTEWVLSFGCSKIVNISKSEQLSALFINKNKMRLIYNSIPDISTEKRCKKEGSQKTKIKILFIGRLDRQKGIDILMDSWTKASKDNLKLEVIGSSVLEKDTKKSKYTDVNFLGWKNPEEVLYFLENADVVVIPSRWEGFGLVALEAMRSSKLVLASDAGALPELVKDGYNGFVFKKNSVHALKDILSFVNKMSESKIRTMGINGRKRYITMFEYQSMLNELNNLYREILK